MKKTRKRANGAGSLIWRRGGYSARWTEVVDGVRVRRSVALQTDSRTVAAAKLKALVSGEIDAPAATAPETFETVARRIVPKSIRTWSERMQRLEEYAFPVIGTRPISKLRAADVKAALERAAAAGKSRQTVHHVRSDVSAVLAELVDDGVIPTNVARGVRLPKGLQVDTRKRVLLADEEFARFINWPGLAPELRTLALMSRMLGGARTADLHAMTWDGVDTIGWTQARVPRPKTDGDALLAIPEQLAPALHAWWVSQGAPSSGPVFPAQKGKRAGEAKKARSSYAKRLRAALWEAGVRRGATKAECSLQVDTEVTRRVDFHSFRRAYATGLARAGVNVQTAMALASHSDAATHQRYVRMTEALEVPVAALPTTSWAPTLPTASPRRERKMRKCGTSLARPSGFEPLTCGSGGLLERADSRFHAAPADRSESNVSQETLWCQRAVPTAARAADAALAAYLRELATAVAGYISVSSSPA